MTTVDEVLNVVNLTEHRVVLFRGETSVACWPPSGTFARIAESTEVGRPMVHQSVTLPTMTVTYGAVVDLPPLRPGTIYLVSRVLAQVATGREDLYFPVDEVRDDQGSIIGCRSLARFGHR